MKRFVAVFVVCTILLTLVFTGCKSTAGTGEETKAGTTTRTTTGTTTTTTADKPKLEVLRFTVMDGKAVIPEGLPYKDIEEQPTYLAQMKAMEEYMGMKIEIVWSQLTGTTAEQRERHSIYLASGNYHDVFNPVAFGTDRKILLELAEDGAIVNLFDYQHLLPNYTKMAFDNPQGENNKFISGWLDGKSYGFAYLRPSTTESDMHPFIIRFDTFEKHDLKIPETLDDLYNVAKQLKQLYPESYPIDSRVATGFASIPQVFLQINRVGQHYRMGYDGIKYGIGPLEKEKEYKDVLIYLNKLYKEELLHPEFFTQSGGELLNRAMTDLTFIIPNTHLAHLILQYVGNEQYPDVKWGIIPRPLAFDGTKGWKLMQYPIGNQWDNFRVSVNSKYEHREELLKFIDYCYSEEIANMTVYGVEGESFKINEEGKPEFLPVIMDLPSGNPRIKKLQEWGTITTGPAGGFGQTFGTLLNFTARHPFYSGAPVYSGGKVWVPDDEGSTTMDWVAEFDGLSSPYTARPQVSLTLDEIDIQRENLTPLFTVLAEGMHKFITGELSFDDDWDSYIAAVKSAGDYQKVTDIYNKHLDERSK